MCTACTGTMYQEQPVQISLSTEKLLVKLHLCTKPVCWEWVTCTNSMHTRCIVSLCALYLSTGDWERVRVKEGSGGGGGRRGKLWVGCVESENHLILVLICQQILIVRSSITRYCIVQSPQMEIPVTPVAYLENWFS